MPESHDKVPEQSDGEPEPFRQWAIIELFGHSQTAGLVSEQEIAGAAFVRVDTPQTENHMAHTKFYNPSAVYSITPTDEATATLAAKQIDSPPVNPWIVPQPKALPEASYRDWDDPDF
jgi:hypothetical protein